jgi:hypothetical protein
MPLNHGQEDKARDADTLQRLTSSVAVTQEQSLASQSDFGLIRLYDAQWL